jgi:hypothetical protein
LAYEPVIWVTFINLVLLSLSKIDWVGKVSNNLNLNSIVSGFISSNPVFIYCWLEGINGI